eukprot:1972256-Prymnesium_polylepis.1
MAISSLAPGAGRGVQLQAAGVSHPVVQNNATRLRTDAGGHFLGSMCVFQHALRYISLAVAQPRVR